MYVKGKHAGQLFWGNTAETLDDFCGPLTGSAAAAGAFRPCDRFPRSEPEARALAEQLGMSWGGTGPYKNKGAYAYKTGPHVGKMWWGTGGNAAHRHLPLNSPDLFRVPMVANRRPRDLEDEDDSEGMANEHANQRFSKADYMELSKAERKTLQVLDYSANSGLDVQIMIDEGKGGEFYRNNLSAAERRAHQER